MVWRIGQKAVCVNDSEYNFVYLKFIRPVKGQIYTISEITDDQYDLAFGLVEIKNNPCVFSNGMQELKFYAWRFRPVVEYKNDISVFQEILKKIEHEVKEDA